LSASLSDFDGGNAPYNDMMNTKTNKKKNKKKNYQLGREVLVAYFNFQKNQSTLNKGQSKATTLCCPLLVINLCSPFFYKY
jgi:hypothetical protein